ncbi:MAG: MBOAT family O-acyltransferase [Vicinamibacteria bacterium]
MTFNSLPFLVFATIFFTIWPLMRRNDQTRWGFLTFASFIFYGWWDWRYTLLLAANGFLDYGVGRLMETLPRQKKRLLITSIMANVGTLAAFKYTGFLAQITNAVLTPATGMSVPVIALALPIGISFYTFHSMSYVIDVYRDDVKPTHSVLHFFAYLTMFPHLVAGPIIRGAEMLPQLRHAVTPTEPQRWEGTSWIAYGFFKKMVIADNIAPVVNAAFGGAHPVKSLPYWWIVVILFAVQIYCDFSGYSDIACGLARWLGYEFPRNFNHPYIATSLRDFWTRWHISLSTWFRDYVYIPLGGRGDSARAWHMNMWITMLLSGLWHGAAWRFLVWGGLHALYRSLERISRWPERLAGTSVGRSVAMLLTLGQVLVAWVFFRAVDMPQALAVVSEMFNPAHMSWAPLAGLTQPVIAFVTLGVLREVLLAGRLGERVASLMDRWTPLEPVLIVAVLVATVFWRGEGNVFIYFQF